MADSCLRTFILIRDIVSTQREKRLLWTLNLRQNPLYKVRNFPILRVTVFLPNHDQMLFMVLLSYFLVTGGIIYDVIVEPPSMGSTTDERGHSRPVAFMQYRINGQGGNLEQSDDTFV